MHKRGFSDVISTLLIILLTFASVIIMWAFVKSLLSKQGETAQTKVELFKERLEIKNAEEGNPNENYVTLIIEKGPVMVVLKETTTIRNPADVPIDLFLVTDLSASMNVCRQVGRWDEPNFYAFAQYGATYAYAWYSCCQYGIGGDVLAWDNKCYLKIDDPGDKCLTVCNNSLNPRERGGVLDNKIAPAKVASKEFVRRLLALQDKRVGLVGFSNVANERFFKELSNDEQSLIEFIEGTPTSGWNSFGGGTCPCCGLKKAIDELIYRGNPNSKKEIILMSDGEPTHTCSGGSGDFYEDTYAQAQRAVENNIRIHSIAYGLEADRAFMKEIARIGGGSYYDSDASRIIQVYDELARSITVGTYKAEKGADYLVVVFYNESASYRTEINNLPKEPFERKLYQIEIGGKIKNITKIEAYPVIITSSGQHIIGAVTSIWQAKK